MPDVLAEEEAEALAVQREDSVDGRIPEERADPARVEDRLLREDVGLVHLDAVAERLLLLGEDLGQGGSEPGCYL